MKLNNFQIAAILDACKGAASKSTLPIMECVAIRNDASGFVAIGQDSVSQITRTEDAITGESFECCIDAAKLSKALTGADSADFKLAEGKLTVKVGRSRFNLPTLPFSDFPAMTLDAGKVIKLPDGAVEAMRKAAPFAAKEDVRYYLKGINWENNHIVGTNGHALCVVEIAEGFDGSMILPAECVGNIPDGVDKVEIADQGATFHAPGIAVTIRKIDGRFPDWRRVVPEPTGDAIYVESGDLLATVGKVSLASDKTSNGGLFRFEGDTCYISTRDNAGNEATAECDAECTGKGYEAGFNIGYIAAMAKCIDGKATIYGMPDRCILAMSDNIRVVVMSMRL